MKLIRILVLFLALTPAAWAQGNFQVGDRVEVDIIMSGAPERAMYRPRHRDQDRGRVPQSPNR